MEIFLQRIQPDKYPLLLKGNDIGLHPEYDGSGKKRVKKKLNLNEYDNNKILKVIPISDEYVNA